MPAPLTEPAPDAGAAPTVARKLFGPTAVATPANAITMARIAGSIVLAVMLAHGQQDWSLALFIVLAATDNIDGLLARRQGTTRSGAFLDPLADKILVGGALIALGIQDEVSWLVVVLIISREIAVSAFRMFAARRGASVPASWFGKIKTLITLVAIGLVLVPDDAVQDVGRVVLWIAVVVTWASAIDYFMRGEQLMRDGRLEAR